MKLLKHCSVFFLSLIILLLLPFIFPSHKGNIAYADTSTSSAYFTFQNYVQSTNMTNPTNILNTSGTGASTNNCTTSNCWSIRVSNPAVSGIPANAYITGMSFKLYGTGTGYYIQVLMGENNTYCLSSPYVGDILTAPESSNGYLTSSGYVFGNCNNANSFPTTVSDLSNFFLQIEAPRDDTVTPFTLINPQVAFTYTVPNPTPFLELPFNYATTFASFSEAAGKINSYFDHTYPYLSGGLTQPSSYQGQVTTFTGDSGNFPYDAHDGYDYGAPAHLKFGDPVLAAAGGTAKWIAGCTGDLCGLGNRVTIDHGNGYETIYGHLKDSWIATMSGQQATVTQGQIIGHVGNSGHSTGPHLHFGLYASVFNSFWNGSTGPWYGVLDPYGWEPQVTGTKDPDPWEHDLFMSASEDENRLGQRSFYLWKHALDTTQLSYSTSTGGSATLDNYSFTLPTGLYATNFSALFDASALIRATYAQMDLQSAGITLSIKATDTLGNPVTSLLSTYTLSIDFSQADLTNLLSNTLAIYSSEDGVTWTKENTTLDLVNHTATAHPNHFSHFALMGQIADEVAPTTTASISGTQGQAAHSYTSDVTLSLSASDNATGSGVQFTLYRIDSGDWQQYSSPFTLTTQGQHSVQYFSGDNVGNNETANTVEIDIDKTPPTSTATLSPAPNADGTYPNPVTVTLSATASAGFSITSKYYKIDSGSQQTYSTPFTVSGSGSHTITYWSVDNAGLTETQNTKTFTIVNPLTSSITDDWSSGSINTSKWDNWGSPQTSVVSQQLHIASTLGGGYYGVDSNVNSTVLSLTGSYVSDQLVDAGNQSLTSWGAYPVTMIKSSDSTYQLYWAVETNKIRAYKKIAGTATNLAEATYNSSVHKWFRIRESSGTIYWDYSTDGISWTNFTSIANPFDITSMTIGINVGTWNTEASTTSATFDNFNRPLTSSLTEDWSSGSINTSKWDNWGTPQTSVASQQLQIVSTLGGGYYGVSSDANGATYSLTGSYLLSQLINAGNQSLTSWGAYPVTLIKSGDNNYQLYWAVEVNKIRAYKRVAGTATNLAEATYNSAVHKWFRIQEFGGTVYWDYSTDGKSWTNFTSTADPFDISNVAVGTNVGTWQTEASTTSALFKNFNITP